MTFNNNIEALIDNYENYNKLDFDEYEFHQIALYYIKKENFTQAKSVLETAINIHTNLYLLFFKAKFSIANNQFDQAINEVDHLLELLNSDNTDDYLNELNNTQEYFSEIMINNPEQLLVLGFEEIAKDFIDKTEDDFDDEDDDDDIDNDDSFDLDILDKEQLKFEITYYSKLLKIEALLNLGDTDSIMHIYKSLFDNSQVEDSDIIYDMADLYQKLLYNKEAISLYQQLIKLGRNSEDILFKLAFCYSNLKDEESAIKIYEKVLSYDSYNIRAWYNIACSESNLGNHQNAIKACDYILSIDKNQYLALNLKAQILQDNEHYLAAAKCYVQLAKIANRNSNLFEAAECYGLCEKYEMAIKLMNEILESFKDKEIIEQLTDKDFYKEYILELAKILRVKALFLIRLKELNSAHDLLIKSIKLDNNSADAYSLLADIYNEQDQTEKCLEALLKSISIEPEQPDTLANIANLYCQNLDFDTAIFYYNEAIQCKDYAKELHFYLAIAYYTTEQYKLCTEQLKLAQGHNKNDVEEFLNSNPEISKHIKLD